jgi:formylglycine-generating enzyme required for sulfatase activity
LIYLSSVLVLFISMVGCKATPAALPTSPFEVVKELPESGDVPNEAVRLAITQTGLPWKIRHRSTGINLLLVPAGTVIPGAPADLPALERYIPPSGLRDSTGTPGDRWNVYADWKQAECRPRRAENETAVSSFYLAESETTVRIWKSVMPDDWRPLGLSAGTQDAAVTAASLVEDYPQTMVTQSDCREFCRRLSWELRLPSEIEWEHAASFAEGAGAIAEPATSPTTVKFDPNQVKQLTPSGIRSALGHRGMVGNAAEICDDAFLPDPPIRKEPIRKADLALEAQSRASKERERNRAYYVREGLSESSLDRLIAEQMATLEFFDAPVIKGGSYLDPVPRLGPWTRGTVEGPSQLFRLGDPILTYRPAEVGFRVACAPPFPPRTKGVGQESRADR